MQHHATRPGALPSREDRRGGRRRFPPNFFRFVRADGLTKYFSKFGEVLIAEVKTDPSTKRSR